MENSEHGGLKVMESEIVVPCETCAKKGKCGFEDWQRLNIHLTKGRCSKKLPKLKVERITIKRTSD